MAENPCQFVKIAPIHHVPGCKKCVEGFEIVSRFQQNNYYFLFRRNECWFATTLGSDGIKVEFSLRAHSDAGVINRSLVRIPLI